MGSADGWCLGVRSDLDVTERMRRRFLLVEVGDFAPAGMLPGESAHAGSGAGPVTEQVSCMAEAGSVPPGEKSA